MDLDIHFKNTLPLLRAGKLQINITKINYNYTYKNSHLPYFVIVNRSFKNVHIFLQKNLSTYNVLCFVDVVYNWIEILGTYLLKSVFSDIQQPIHEYINTYLYIYRPSSPALNKGTVFLKCISKSILKIFVYLKIKNHGWIWDLIGYIS